MKHKHACTYIYMREVLCDAVEAKTGFLCCASFHLNCNASGENVQLWTEVYIASLCQH